MERVICNSSAENSAIALLWPDKVKYYGLSCKNCFMLLLWWCPFKIQKRKTGSPPVDQHGLFELSIDPSKDLLDNTVPLKCSPVHIYIGI